VSSTLRPPAEEDLPEVVRLMNEHWPEPVDEETVRRAWTSPGVQIEEDARLEQGSYTLIETIAEGRVWIDLRGRPSAAMLDWAEGRARQKATRIFAGAWSSNEALLRELEGRGFGLLHAFAELRARGLIRAGLGVDAESLTGANRLYEQSGMRVRVRFDIYEKAAS